jgi:hypothetical protein
MFSENMLAWDIETMGFDGRIDLVTVAAVYSNTHSHIYQFATSVPCAICKKLCPVHAFTPGQDGGSTEDDGCSGGSDSMGCTCVCETHVKKVVKVDGFDQIRDAFARELDDAPVLAAFNGIGFDIPFVTAALKVSPDRVMKWVLKSLDVFEICKRASHRTFPLNMVLDLNGKTSKTGDGGQAVVQASMGLWQKLGEYCLEDAKLTFDLSQMTRIALPEGYLWRKQHKGATHDPKNLLYLNFKDGVVDFELGGGKRVCK